MCMGETVRVVKPESSGKLAHCDLRQGSDKLIGLVS